MFLLWAIAARKIAGFVSWLGQQLIVFRSAFSRPRFAARGSFRHRVASDRGEHLVDELILLARRPPGGSDHRCPMTQRIERSFEADPLQRHPMQVGAAQHQAADEVVGDAMEEHFALDQFGTFAYPVDSGASMDFRGA